MIAGTLIIDDPAEGPWNMAVDEVLLQTAASAGKTILRFYEWSKPTLSLGYFQKQEDRQGHVPSKSCPIVRRSTGGGAILHDCELTYCFAVPAEDNTTKSRLRLYNTFHQTLIRALTDWGIEASQQTTTLSGNSDKSRDFLCFRQLSTGDVLIHARKVAGSAQRRTRQSIMPMRFLTILLLEFA